MEKRMRDEVLYICGFANAPDAADKHGMRVAGMRVAAATPGDAARGFIETMFRTGVLGYEYDSAVDVHVRPYNPAHPERVYGGGVILVYLDEVREIRDLVRGRGVSPSNRVAAAKTPDKKSMEPNMIVTTGKIVRIKAGDFFLEKSCETPGGVRVKGSGGSIMLPGNKEDAARFIEAYLAAVNEDIEYRKTEVR